MTIHSKKELKFLMEKYLGDTDEGHLEILWHYYSTQPEEVWKENLGLSQLFKALEEDGE